MKTLLGIACAVMLLFGARAGAQTVCTSEATLEARAFVTGPWRIIPVGVGGPNLCLRFESVGGSYVNEQVDMTSITLTSLETGSVTSISCIAAKSAIEGDLDGNGVRELPAWFGQADLARLFDRIKGRVEVTAIVQGNLADGSTFCGPASLTLIHPKHHPRSLVTPNPFHAGGVLRVMTSRAGSLRARIFDLQGRLVSTLDHGHRTPGEHVIRVDGVDLAGRPLPSGIYFYVVETGDGATRGRFAIVN
ncbi:MAG TPA: T9SS type A sorting domain-containing protein [Candidatus Eisenbacteria bacterium]|nr:T9SS type A sorting domain-containing protein [Candidatus Eisenbacteria bacterium]